MPGPLTLSALLGLVVAAVWIWRASRRAFRVSLLEGVAVSRQWLMEHRSDN